MSPRGRVRLLMSGAARARLSAQVGQALAGVPHVIVTPEEGSDCDAAFISRDVTGRSTKHELQPQTVRFYDALRAAPGLRWVHTHSAGTDRPIFGELRARGVRVTNSSGSNARVVAHAALAGMLALARRLPQLLQAQRERRWAPLFGADMPCDFDGQTTVLVGWGPIGQALAPLLQALGQQVVVVRRSDEAAGPGLRTVTYDGLAGVLPQADWLVLACPLSERTAGLVGAAELALLRPAAQLVNVARGEVVDEAALADALRGGRLAGAFLDVYAHEPLPAESLLWDLPNVIATPHCAGFSSGNEARVDGIFLRELSRWHAAGAN